MEIMKTFEITKEQILELYDLGSIHQEDILKEWFPAEAFTPDLGYGKWLKDDSNSKWMGFQVDATNKHGFNANGDWFDHQKEYDATKDEKNRLATEAEIKTALTAELIKRYGNDWENVKIKSHAYGDYNSSGINKNVFNISITEDRIFNKNGLLYDNGIWAEILPQEVELTLQEIAYKFGIDVNHLKIKK